MALERPYLENRRSYGPVTACLRLLLVLVLWVPLVVTPWLALRTYASWCAQVPAAPEILEHDGGDTGIDILASDGVRIGGTLVGRRPWVSIDRIPPRLVGAFVAAEDESFFFHDGVDPFSIARAVWTNLRRHAVAQGGSTITQQLAKMYVGRERTYDRKLREALLARRIEASYTKLEILEAYLNRIYLGAGAHGVAAAAERYFGRPLEALQLDEVALIAGLTSAPSRLDPFRNPQGALARRHYVLRRMAELGMISEAERSAADVAPLVLDASRPDDTSAPYVADEVRRELRGLREDGRVPPEATELTVDTEVNLPLQWQAVRAVAHGAEQVARRRQDRATVLHLERSEWPAFLEDAVGAYGVERRTGEEVLGIVYSVRDDDVWVDTGGTLVHLDAEGLSWARHLPLPEPRPGKRRVRPPPPRPMAEFARVGHLVLVRVTSPGSLPGMPARGELVPVDDVQGALVSLDVDSGGMRAVAGGTGYDVSQFNRVTRGCRQPGSAFKPVLYSLALEMGLSPASLVVDLPVRYEDASGNLVWEPRNADRDFKGALLLAAALARSRNLPAVKLLHQLGIDRVVEHAQRLGIHSRLRRTPSLALGASCVSPLEMTATYGAFATRGRRLDPFLVRSVRDAGGNVLVDRAAFFATTGPLDARLHRLARWLTPGDLDDRQAMRPDAAYMTTYMLREVVRRGTGKDAAVLGVPIAGKTGTTNSFDVWFVGFTEDVLTGVWIGDDRNRHELGEGESGGTSALPVWVDFMRLALSARTQADPLEHPPPRVEYVRIDPETGLRAHPEAFGLWMPFVEGSAPVEVAPGPVERAAADADLVDRSF